MEAFSLIISILTLGFSLFVYFAHDKKLNAQQKQLNELALQKAAQEDEARKKAIIFLSYERVGRNDKLVVTNKGQATAYDIRISSQVERDPVMVVDIPPQWDFLKPGQSANHPIVLDSEIISVTYDISWRDELGEHSDKQMVVYM